MKKIAIFIAAIVLVANLSFSGGGKVKVIIDKAILYAGPQLTAERLDVFYKGTILNVLGSGEKNGWYNVTGRSQQWGGMISGFIQASQVELIEETLKPVAEEVQEAPKMEETQQIQRGNKPAEKKPSATEEQEEVDPVAKAEEIDKTVSSTIPADIEKKSEWKKFSIRLGYNAGFATQNKSVSWQQEIYYENAAFGVDYSLGKGNSFNGALGFKFSRSLGVEIGFDICSRNLNGSYDASIPHPLYFNSLRQGAGTASFKVTENAAFINLILSVPLSRLGLDFVVGPAYFFTNAELISSLQYSQSYPYSSVSLAIQNQKISKNVFGFNAGASLTFYFAQSIGVFISGQYLSANAEFKPAELPGLKLSLGGLKAGGGIKLSF